MRLKTHEMMRFAKDSNISKEKLAVIAEKLFIGDAGEDGEAKWITTEKGKHIQINGETGEVLKGNIGATKNIKNPVKSSPAKAKTPSKLTSRTSAEKAHKFNQDLNDKITHLSNREMKEFAPKFFEAVENYPTGTTIHCPIGRGHVVDYKKEADGRWSSSYDGKPAEGSTMSSNMLTSSICGYNRKGEESFGGRGIGAEIVTYGDKPFKSDRKFDSFTDGKKLSELAPTGVYIPSKDDEKYNESCDILNSAPVNSELSIRRKDNGNKVDFTKLENGMYEGPFSKKYTASEVLKYAFDMQGKAGVEYNFGSKDPLVAEGYTPSSQTKVTKPKNQDEANQELRKQKFEDNILYDLSRYSPISVVADKFDHMKPYEQLIIGDEILEKQSSGRFSLKGKTNGSRLDAMQVARFFHNRGEEYENVTFVPSKDKGDYDEFGDYTR